MIKETLRQWRDAIGTGVASLSGAGLPAWRLGQSTVWDDFTAQPNGALVQTLSGHKWEILPGNSSSRVAPEIIDGVMTARPSGHRRTAAYPAIRLGSKPRQVRATICFQPGRDGAGAALILTKTLDTSKSDISHIVAWGSVHIVFTNRKAIVGLFKNKDYFVARTIYYPRAIPKDGSPHVVGFDLLDDDLTIYGPGVAGVKVSHPRVSELSGRILTVEPYWERGQGSVGFAGIQVI